MKYRSKIDLKDPARAIRIELKYEKELLQQIARFERSVKDALRKVERHQESPAFTLTGIEWYQRQVDQSAQTLDVAGKETAKKYTEVAYKRGLDHGKERLQQAQIPVPDTPFQIILGGPASKRTIDRMLLNNLNDITKMSDDLKAEVKRAILDGLEKGESLDKIAKRISDAAEVGRKRAKLISRTEVMKAVNSGTLDRYKMAGIEPKGGSKIPPLHPACRCTTVIRDGKIYWLSGVDGRCCDDCIDLDGKEL